MRDASLFRPKSTSLQYTAVENPGHSQKLRDRFQLNLSTTPIYAEALLDR